MRLTSCFTLLYLAYAPTVHAAWSSPQSGLRPSAPEKIHADQIAVDVAGIVGENQIAVDFSHAFASGWVLDLAPRLGVPRLASLDVDKSRSLGPSVGVSLGARTFLTGDPLGGLFLGSSATLDHFYGRQGAMSRVRLGCSLGYQLSVARRVTVALSAGPDVSIFTSTLAAADHEARNEQVQRLRGLRPRGQLRVGFAF